MQTNQLESDALAQAGVVISGGVVIVPKDQPDAMLAILYWLASTETPHVTEDQEHYRYFFLGTPEEKAKAMELAYAY